MNRNAMFERILPIQNNVEKLRAMLREMENADIEKRPDIYEKLSVDAALLSEQIACHMRHLIYRSTAIKKAEYLGFAGIMQGIKICFREDFFEITLPCLFPKRKQRQSTEFLIDPVYFILSQYADENKLPKFSQCVVCFSHIYSRELSFNRIRDYDNLELKQLLDVIAAFVMEDDTGFLCDTYNTTEIGENDCTRVTVMNKNHFLEWLGEHKIHPENISNF